MEGTCYDEAGNVMTAPGEGGPYYSPLCFEPDAPPPISAPPSIATVESEPEPVENTQTNLCRGILDSGTPLRTLCGKPKPRPASRCTNPNCSNFRIISKKRSKPQTTSSNQCFCKLVKDGRVCGVQKRAPSSPCPVNCGGISHHSVWRSKKKVSDEAKLKPKKRKNTKKKKKKKKITKKRKN